MKMRLLRSFSIQSGMAFILTAIVAGTHICSASPDIPP